MKKVKEILNGLDFTIEEFWEAIDKSESDPKYRSLNPQLIIYNNENIRRE